MYNFNTWFHTIQFRRNSSKNMEKETQMKTFIVPDSIQGTKPYKKRSNFNLLIFYLFYFALTLLSLGLIPILLR